MKNLLFDTDVLIDILKNNTKTIKQIEALTSEAEAFYCSTINIGEIFAGMRPNEEKATRKLLETLTVFDVTTQIAELAGTLKYKTKTHTLWLDDCLIAATAITHGCVLVSKNIKHYPFADLPLARIE